jgi:IclR family acetate operon transcriptional repressor
LFETQCYDTDMVLSGQAATADNETDRRPLRDTGARWAGIGASGGETSTQPARGQLARGGPEDPSVGGRPTAGGSPPNGDPAGDAGPDGLVAAETPGLRLIGLIDVIAASDRPVSLASLVESTGIPKPTVHRMLQQLEGAGLLERPDGRHYVVGVRLRRMAEQVLLNDTHHGARHAVLRHLVEELGESCNITALSGDEVIYLDRVETPEPLRFHLRPGSKVPCHATASGKILLAAMTPSQRRQLLAHAPLRKCTDQTITDLDTLERELATVRRNGFALDNEEFLPGLLCVAVPVPTPGQGRRARLCVAVQAPIVRLPVERALDVLPALHRAAAALGAIEHGTTAGEPDARDLQVAAQ